MYRQVKDVRDRNIVSANPLPRKFAIELYLNTVAQKEEENVFISPFSVETCLSLALMGAGGKTASEIKSVLSFDDAQSAEEISATFGECIRILGNSTSLKMACKMYIQNGYDVKEKFNQIASQEYQTSAENVNFEESTESAERINSWVKEQTNGKIVYLITPELLNRDTRMLLINAIYFKGQWENKFKPEQTKSEPFWVSNTQSIPVAMMNIMTDLRYTAIEELDASAIILPFTDPDIRMILFVPKSRDGLHRIEQKLRHLDMDDFEKKTCHPEVILKMPKFQIDFSMSLKDSLKQMGLSSMFENANFSELLEQKEPLAMSDVVHKTFLEVNEEGAEAAAATGMRFVCCSGPKPVKLTLDRPFLYVIMSKSNEILFIGNYKKP